MEIADLIALADNPALVFLNSTATPLQDTIEFLGDGQAYLLWLARAGLIDIADLDRVATRFAGADLDAVAAEAVALREWLRPLITAWVAAPESALPAEVHEHLNEILAADHQFTQIRTGADGARELHERRHWLDARQLLVPPADAAAQLFTTADRSLVRNCEDPTCTLWFYDRTKSHRRRWCSMAVCGNRAKARNHRQFERSRTG